MADENRNTESFALGVLLAVVIFIFFHRQLDKVFSKFASGGDGARGGGCGGGSRASACNCGGGTGEETPTNPDVALGPSYASGGLSFS